MNDTTRRKVRRRAGGNCEYCRLQQQFDVLPHHVDHVIARKHLGPDSEDNLALACTNCSLAKGSNIAGYEPSTNKLTRLFHPRRDRWRSHFRWKGPILIGRTGVGRTTVLVLNINDPDRVALRRTLLEQGLFPPPLEV